VKFEYINLGQTIIKYQVPHDIFLTLNAVYENEFKSLPSANETLIGKIQKESSIYYNGEDESKIKKHNFIPIDILLWFEEVYKHYLEFNKIYKYKIRVNSIWVNEMKEHEYNPTHIHRGTLFTGLSSVMILGLPDTYGTEYSSSDKPQNGRLQILGSASGQFAKIDYQPPMNLRDFYVFPYDMRHCVYPFNGTDQTRRTLAANCDVEYNPITTRGAV